jgi:hypothetical protein
MLNALQSQIAQRTVAVAMDEAEPEVRPEAPEGRVWGAERLLTLSTWPGHGRRTGVRRVRR